MKMIYLAYGSNLNKDQMKMRCPDAIEVGKFFLPDWRLVFRGVADIEKADGFQVPVGAWEITNKCEKALDRYEGFPVLYRKQYFKSGDKRYMAYVMNRNGYARPPQMYYEAIKQGFEDFSLPMEYLTEALKHSLNNHGSNGHTPKRYKDAKLI